MNLLNPTLRRFKAALPALLIAGLLGTLASGARAVVGPEDYPIATSRSDAVKPNIMLLMDTSTSMSFTHMPDEVEGEYNNPRVGYFSFQCNVLYFNPAGNGYYKVPKRADGTFMPTPRFSGAPYNAYLDFPATTQADYDLIANNDGRLRNLNSLFRAYETTTRRNVSGGSDTAQRAYYWVYTAANGTKPQLAYDAPQCRDGVDSTVSSFSATGGGTWNRFTLDDTSALSSQFALWYTYYRTRMGLIKSAMTLAFNSSDPVIGPKYRVGMVSMNPYAVDSTTGLVSNSSSVLADKYEPMRTFGNTERAQWFSKLFSQTPAGYSPAREGLARVGRHFANKTDSINTGMAYASGENPFQYSCQRNYTIMTTDGYWNTQNETAGPVKLDGTTVIGQEDGNFTSDVAGNTPMGVYDGSTTGTRFRTTQANQYQIVVCSTGQFYVSTTQKKARIVQYRERSDQTEQREDKWQKITTQFTRTIEQYKQSTHNWYTTQLQRTRESWTVNSATTQYLEYRIEQRGGGYTQTQSYTKWDRRTTTSFPYRDEAYKYRNFQWNAATSRKTSEQYRWTRNVVQNVKTEKYDQRRTTQFQLTQTQFRATGYTDYATRSQQWGISWRYEVYSNETWKPGSSAQCTAAGNGNCRVRNVVADTVDYNTSNIPSTNAAMTSCAATSPNSGNQYTTTTCESSRRYLDGSGNFVGSPTPVAVNGCVDGSMSGKTLTNCSRSSFTDIPVKSCSGGYSGYVNPTILSVSVVSSCPTTPTVTQAMAPANVANCSAYPTQLSSSPYTTTSCTDTSTPWTNVTFGSCSSSNSTSPNFQKVECQTLYCTAANCTSGTTTVSSFGIQNAAPTCPAPTDSTHVVSCASANNSAEPLNALTCTDQTAGTGNGWTQKTCNAKVVVTAIAPVANCTAGTTKSNTTPFVITSCVNTTTGPTPVYDDSPATCPVVTTADSSNNWTTSSCTKVITNNDKPTASCTSSMATSSPYVHKECYSLVTNGYLSTACTASAAVATTYVERTCPGNSTVTTGVPFGTCAAQAHTFNGTDTVTCNTTNGPWTNVATCNVITPNAGNEYLDVQCQNIEVAGTQVNCNLTPTHCVTVYEFPEQPVAACTYAPGTGSITASSAGSITYLNTNANGRRFYCTVKTASATSVQNCTSGNSGNPTNANPAPATAYIQTTCTNTAVVTDTVAPATCAVGTATATSAPYTRTNCYNSYVTDGTGPINDRATATCSAGYDTPSKVTTTCRETSTPLTPVASCSPANGSSPATAPSFTSSECTYTSSTVPGPAACTVGSVDANFVRVIACPTAVPSAPVFVASCTGVAQTANAGNSYTRITCGQASGYPTATRYVESGTCTAGFNSTTGVTTVCTQLGHSWQYAGVCPNGIGIVPATSPNWLRTECETTTSATGTVNVATGLVGSTWDSASSSFIYKPVSDCPADQTGSAGNSWLSLSCQSLTTPQFNGDAQTSCTPVAAAAPNYIATICTPLTGQQVQYKGTTTRTAEILSGINPPVVVKSTPTVLVAPGAWTNIGSCQATVSIPSTITVPSPADIYAQVGSAAPELDGCAAWGSCESPIGGATAGGSTGSLADIAQYYYVNDLKPQGTSTVGKLAPKDANAVLSDRATHVHMTTFSVGMGVSGRVVYQDDYQTNTTGDFAKILANQQLAYGGTNWPVWPDTTISSSTPLSYFDNPKSIDDFWHTAVNGRGRYLSAGDPEKVTEGLRSVLADIDNNYGAGSAATTSTPVPVVGDNALFRANFNTKYWSGELTASTIDPLTGAVSATNTWTAAALLDAKTGLACDNRKIFYFKSSNSNKLANFAWNSKACDTAMAPTGTAVSDLSSDSSVSGFFDTSESSQMTQYAQSSYGGTSAQRDLAVGANLVNYLRGQRGMEGFVGGNVGKLFRTREDVLGTIVGSQPLYVKAPNRSYADNGYYGFKTDAIVSARPAMVYVGANDGMMHAFNAATGQEAWAYVPTMVMPNLFKLANVDYDHNFYVDGSVISGDIVVDHTSTTPVWKTIVVGGLNKGGRGFYALDVTDPSAAGVKALWEFKGSANCYDAEAAVGKFEDCGVGLSFGRPIITKLSTGQWVVLVTSGYDSESFTGGNGRSYLYVLNAYTGAIIHKIAASATVGSGLREIETYVSDASNNNTTQRAYGGDLLGNVWRFDVNGTLAPTVTTPAEARYEATLVARAADASGNAQPITNRPIIGEVRGKTLVVVGTGQLLNQNDLTVPTPAKVQSVYAFLDTAVGASSNGTTGDVLYPNATGTGSLRGTLKPLKLTTVANTNDTERTIQCDTSATNYSEALCNSDMNWQVDLPAAGERVNLDMVTVGGTLVFVSNVPSTADACSVGGYSFVNAVDILSGLPVSGTNTTVSYRLLANSLSVGATVTRHDISGVTNPGGGGGGGGTPACEDRLTVTGAANTLESKCIPKKNPGADGRRVSWRELIRE